MWTDVVVLALLVGSVIAMTLRSATDIEGTDQPLVWASLDVAETIAVAATGVGMLRARSVLIPATITASLLTIDAVINLGVARGHALHLAIIMAAVELSAAAFSGWLAARRLGLPQPRSQIRGGPIHPT